MTKIRAQMLQRKLRASKKLWTSPPPEAIRDQPTSEYGEKFTQEEADYAVTNIN